ncbi:MAG: nuclear transport factor 2 family protein, partial [Phycisphaerales bacterium]|nr:nuclear transport factor 2 family protein [Phycisphaerales bacterium]
MTHWLLALLTLFAPADLQNERASINTMLNDWHRAARLADEDAYFAHFAGDDAVFMGTDATERWTAKEFRVWAHPYFERGKAWEFFCETPFERNIAFNDTADTAWFDEQLVTPNMGPCRGTGVLIKQNDQWKIAHYNLSIPLPNVIVDDVVAMAAQELLGEEQMYTPRPGEWHAWLDTPGGKLPFRLVFQTQAGRLVPFIVNGGEYIEVTRVEINRQTNEVILAFDHYDSIIRAEIDQLGLRMHGTWTKRRGPDNFATIPFHASAGEQQLFPNIARTAHFNERPFSIRQPVRFDQSEETAIFAAREVYPSIIEATFETPTGDYRYLAGNMHTNDRIQLSVFDGAHAFLFDIKCADDGSLTGDFWSGDWWHDTFKSAAPDTPRSDPWAMTTASERAPDWSALSFMGSDGQTHKLSEWDHAPRLVYLFGTWCPNCADATQYLKQLREEFPDLRVLGLAFEVTGDADRDMSQVRRYTDHHKTDWPLLLAGTSDKADATKALPFLSGVKAYPTFIFIQPGGEIDSIYTGFAGPATGESHEQLKREFTEA